MRPTRGWNGFELKKKKNKEKLDVTQLKTQLQTVDFCFFTKTTLIKKIDQANPVKTRNLSFGPDQV